MAISYNGCTCGAGGGGGGECECPPTCVTTTCVLRCDDTTGDGLADTTYSELWCIKQDGTSQLVLTYQGDPSEPYTPISPVDCEHGTMQCHTELLCDDSGRPFLRTFTFLSNGTATYVDVEIDGQTPHVVVGAVRSCDGGSDCAEQRAPLATLGLCLADGTPIGVIVTRDCDGAIQQQGWLNLATGAYSAGAPPVGVQACGQTRSVSTSGTWCDTDPSGNVLGLVLVEYTYDANGQIASVRLVDATTGLTYVPQGTVTVCPTGQAQPDSDLIVLCETKTDGTVVRFVRDFHRDENNLIVGHTDYLLDGTNYQPAPTSTVGDCTADCAFQYVLRNERCDDTDGDGQPDTMYVELIAVDCDGQLTTLATRTCDLSAVYAPVAPIDCDVNDGSAPEPEPGATTFTTLCDIAADGTPTPFLRKITYTVSGYVLETADVALDGTTPYRVHGTVGVCGPGEDCPVTNLIQQDRCDDTDGDGIADTWYVELLGVDCRGELSSVGTYTCDLAAVYVPVAPVDCDAPNPVVERPVGVQAHRVQLTAGQVWNAAAYGTLRTVSTTARNGAGEITTAEGVSALDDGETASWAISKDMDVRLVGPLAVRATTGTVTINFTTGVDL
jgi:hypothetical protein